MTPIGPAVCTGQAGVAWLRLQSSSSTGTPLIAAASDVASKFEAFLIGETGWVLHPTSSRELKFKVGQVSGGSLPSVPLQSLELWMRVSFPSGVGVEAAVSQVRGALASFLSRYDGVDSAVDTDGISGSGFEATGHPLLPALRRGWHSVLGEPAADAFLPFASDARFFDEVGIPATCFGGAVYEGHTTMESVDVDEALDQVIVLATALADYAEPGTATALPVLVPKGAATDDASKAAASGP